MTKKKKKTVFIIIFILIFLAMFVSLSKISQTAFPSREINIEILKTSISKVSEDNEFITYRYNWVAVNDSDIELSEGESIKIEFNIGDKEALDNKLVVSDSLENQFNVKTNEVTLININPYKIKEQEAVCSLVIIENLKPIISCSIDFVLYNEESTITSSIINFDGYADLTFQK